MAEGPITFPLFKDDWYCCSGLKQRSVSESSEQCMSPHIHVIAHTLVVFLTLIPPTGYEPKAQWSRKIDIEARERDNDLDNSTCGSHEFEKQTNYEGSHNKKESLNASLLRQRAHTREPRRQHVLE